jgi:hypothetical protein
MREKTRAARMEIPRAMTSSFPDDPPNSPGESSEESTNPPAPFLDDDWGEYFDDPSLGPIGLSEAQAGPSVLTEALEYARLGLRVVRVKPSSKFPDQRKWPSAATCDKTKIRRWVRKKPGSNVGLVMGNGVFAVDVDPKNGGESSLKELTDEHGALPATAEAKTGGGGRHLLFRYDPEAYSIPNSVGTKLGQGIDIRAERGYIVVSPSIHPITKLPYQWVTHPRQGIANAPTWLVQKVSGGRSGTKKQESQREDSEQGSADVGARSSVADGEKGQTASRTGNLRPTRPDERERLTSDIIAQYPLTDTGQRRNKMALAVASLIGRGQSDETVIAVVSAWYDHYYARGVINTGKAESHRELLTCVRSTRNNRTFQVYGGESSHLDACARINLTDWQRQMITTGVVIESSGEISLLLPRSERTAVPQCAPPTTGTEGSRIRVFGWKMCISPNEVAFVESLLVLAIYTLQEKAESCILFTWSQIRKIAHDRHPLFSRENKLSRLIEKYVTREGKPATCFELIRVIRKGEPSLRTARATPTKGEIIGLACLLPSPQGDGRESCDQLPVPVE